MSYDDQPPMQHLAPIFPSYCAIPRRVPHGFFHTSTHPFAMLPLRGVILELGLPSRRFPCTSLYITHFTPSLIVWPKNESLRRTTNPSRHPSCLVVFNSVKIPWSVRCPQFNWFIDPQFCWFDHFLISFRRSPVDGLDENRPHQPVHCGRVILSSLCLFLCLSRSVTDRAISSILFLAFQFVTLCHC